jgi:hypothetical protein
MSTPIAPPSNASPGAQSVTGSGLTPDAYGTPGSANPPGEFMPAGVSIMPKGPSAVSYTNGAVAPPAGGGAKVASQIKSGPMQKG